MATNYTAKDITVLEGLEPVRKRPGMYIGGVGSAGLHHLVWERVGNAVSKELIGTVKRDGSTWEMRFKQGKPMTGLKKVGPARGTGTTVYFKPDSAIFPKIE